MRVTEEAELTEVQGISLSGRLTNRLRDDTDSPLARSRHKRDNDDISLPDNI